MNWLLVIVGAMVGAPLRYLTDRAVQLRHDTVFPWGTLVVNVTGCLVLGLLTGAASAGHASAHLQLLIGTGLCGALTTYSTFSYETLRLTETGFREQGWEVAVLEQRYREHVEGWAYYLPRLVTYAGSLEVRP